MLLAASPAQLLGASLDPVTVSLTSLCPALFVNSCRSSRTALSPCEKTLSGSRRAGGLESQARSQIIFQANK